MSDVQEQTVLSVFTGFPVYLFNYVFGFVLAVASDITLTSLAVGSAALGLATTFWVGIATFFLGHTVIKAVNALNGAIVTNGRHVAQAGIRLASVFEQTTPATPSTVQDPASER